MCRNNNGLTGKKSKSCQFLHKTFFVKSIKSHEVTNLLSISDCKGLWRGWASNLAKQLNNFTRLTDQSNTRAFGLGYISDRISKIL